MKVIDLFSGLGGFSQAFVDRGHEVERYDFDEKFKEVPHTTIKNVMDMTLIDLEHADIILASPPCNAFSTMTIRYYWNKDGLPNARALPFIKLAKHTKTIIKSARAKYWIIENPRGMMRRVLGKPSKTTFWAAWGTRWLKPTDLWGVFPPIDWKIKECAKWVKAPRGSKTGIQDGRTKPEIRAMIPYEFSLAVCLAAEGNSPQTTISDFS